MNPINRLFSHCWSWKLKRSWTMLIFGLAMCTSYESNAIPIARRNIPGLLKEAPVIVKGKILSVQKSNATQVFRLEKYLKSRGVTKRAKVAVDSVIKGDISRETISVLFFDGRNVPFTKLCTGKSYILFLANSKHGFKLYDPANGGFQIKHDGISFKKQNPMSRLQQVLEYSLTSKDEQVLQTALLGIAQVGNAEILPRLQPFLRDKRAGVEAATISACLHLGQWQLVTNAIHILERPKKDILGSQDLGITSMNPYESLTRGVASVTNSNAVPLLMDLVKNSKEESLEHRLLLEALAGIGSVKSVPIFLNMLDDPDWDTSYFAYRALIKARGDSSYLAQHAFRGDRKNAELEELQKWARRLNLDEKGHSERQAGSK